MMSFVHGSHHLYFFANHLFLKELNMSKLCLIVDDEPDIRLLISMELEDYGFSVLEACNGKEAFEIIKNNKVDFLISDVKMAGGSGIELLDNLIEYDGAKPIVTMMSGFPELNEEKALKAGVVHVFNKPFNLEEIVLVIETHLLGRKVG